MERMGRFLLLPAVTNANQKQLIMLFSYAKRFDSRRRLDRFKNCNLGKLLAAKLNCEFKSRLCATCRSTFEKKRNPKSPFEKYLLKITTQKTGRLSNSAWELDATLAAKRDRVFFFIISCAHMSFYGYTIGDEC